MVIIVNNELIELITVLGNDENNNGFCTSENVERTGIFASTKSANRLEYYEALRAGVNASIIFVVDMDDYKLSEREVNADGQTRKVSASRISYDGAEYLIQRTYRNNFGMLEITCGKVE